MQESSFEEALLTVSADPRGLYLHSVGQVKNLNFRWRAVIYGTGDIWLFGDSLENDPVSAIYSALRNVRDIRELRKRTRTAQRERSQTALERFLIGGEDGD